MAQSTVTEVQTWDGPYTFNVSSDSRATDGCGASINNSEAFSQYSDGEGVKLRVEENGCEVVYSHTVKTSHSGSQYSTIPMKHRQQLELTPGDSPTFYVCRLENVEPKPDALITRSGGVYHKITSSGESYCGVVSQGSYRNRGNIPTYESLIEDDYELCSACESKLETSNLTLDQLEREVIQEYDLDPSVGVLSKKNLYSLLDQEGYFD